MHDDVTNKKTMTSVSNVLAYIITGCHVRLAAIPEIMIMSVSSVITASILFIKWK